MTRALRIAGALLAAGLALPLAGATQDVRSVQAAFLYRFLYFIEDQPLSEPDGELCLGILGPDPYGELLDEVDGRTIRGAQVRVRRFGVVREVGDCELVFVSPDVRGGADAAVRAIEGRRILTVSTLEGFARRGGIVELRVQGDRVRFDLNRGAAKRNKLRLDAELLEVARRILP